MQAWVLTGVGSEPELTEIADRTPAAGQGPNAFLRWPRGV
jgi:hypothetical protein